VTVTDTAVGPDLTRAIRFEAVRVRVSRPVRWIAAVGVALHVVVGLAVTAYMAFDPSVTTPYPASDVARLVIASPPVLSLTAAFVGLVIGGMDHRHGTVSLTVLVSPRRRAALGGKVAVALLAAAAVALLGGLLSVVLLEAVYVPARGQSIAPGPLTLLVLAQVLKVALWAAAGVLAAVATRSQTAAGVAVLVLSSLVEPALRSVAAMNPQAWWSELPEWMPFTAIDGVTRIAMSGSGSAVFSTAGLAPGGSLAVALVWLTALAVGADRSARAARSTAPRGAMADEGLMPAA
jgi:hypothetical protein